MHVLSTATRGIAIGSAVLALAVTGCSASTSKSSTPPSPTGHESVSPSASATPTVTVSPSPSMSDVLPPVTIDGSQKEVTAAVGDVLYITTKDATKVETDNPAVLKVTQPEDDGTTQYAGGATVIAGGEAFLTVSGASGQLYKVLVKAS